MNLKYIEKLEYSTILDNLSEFCTTDYGKELCRSLLPSSNKQEVSNLLEETSEAIRLLSEKELSFGNIKPIDYCLKILNSNGVLNLEMILQLTQVLKTSAFLKDSFYTDHDTSNFPICETYFSKLYYNPSMIKAVENAIVDENTISDTASSKLSSLRKEMKKLEDEIREKLNHFLHSPHSSKYIQESIITMRNNRYVIPIKEEYRGMVKGFLHDISTSGSTVFIEPMSVFELNNQLHVLQLEEVIEIEHILQELSLLFSPYIAQLEEDYITIGTIDFVFAKAKYALFLNAIKPRINDEKYISLVGARHPLIEKDSMVPLTIEIGKSFCSLIITGPNTGGKTVSLKTTGLLCLMACSGLLIPAKEESSIYVFDQYFADIGDEQSIAESLSTFSSHMSHIIHILEESTSESFVLLDELGSGTDPIEGSSLAISILETLYHRNTLCISTSHYVELKHYALVTDGFENASVRV